ncbi:hypothetical protein FRC14_002037 [Serendipita sp. 396]|nr:hypothetical protein FRC14_002037 [Serendipita sp. 396]KAG8787059.1 hypothetical protein FRC15_010135 [Serendipita sp. 397]KAG8800922.1 hypothetical protein FRC16_001748 [Serendipita sp. 398]KAG8869101.1 hypothetical protein FRC20_002123 [Serendipita sp. 405]
MASTTKEPLRDGDVSDMEVDGLDEKITLIEEMLGDSGSNTPSTSTKNSAGSIIGQTTLKQTDKKANVKESGSNRPGTPDVLEAAMNSNSVECDRCALKKILCVLAKQTTDQGRANLACMACYMNRSKCHWQHTAVKELAYQQLDESGLNMRQSGPSSLVPEEVQRRFASVRAERNASLVERRKRLDHRKTPTLSKRVGASRTATPKYRNNEESTSSHSSDQDRWARTLSESSADLSRFFELLRWAARLEVNKILQLSTPSSMNKSIPSSIRSFGPLYVVSDEVFEGGFIGTLVGRGSY